MLKIFGDNHALWQWDTGQKLIVEDNGICREVHFCNNYSDKALVLPIMEQDGIRVVDVPNILLQEASMLTAYLFSYDANGSETKFAYRFSVRPRPKPDSYIYTETEVLNYASIDKRLNYLEQNQLLGGGFIASDVAPEDTSVLWIDTDEDEVDNLQNIISEALAQAKVSGEFDGKDGVDGKDGYTPQKGVDYFDGADGKDGQNGSDYVLTEADKQEIAEQAAQLVDIPEGGSAESVQYTEQSLSEEQQMQARKNLGLYGFRKEFVTLGEIYSVFGGETVDLAGYVMHAGLDLDTTKPLVMELFDPHTHTIVHSATYYPQGEDYFDYNQYTDCNYWYWGNHSLLQNDATAWQYLSHYQDKNGYDDAPFVICSLFDEYLGWYRKLILSPDLDFPGLGGYQVFLRSNDKEPVYDKIPHNYIPTADGGNVGGVKADPATEEDTQPVRIGNDGKLYTAPTGGGSGSGIIVSDTEPDDTSVLWADTSDNSVDDDPMAEYYTKNEIDNMLGNYVNDIASLVGGDA